MGEDHLVILEALSKGGGKTADELAIECGLEVEACIDKLMMLSRLDGVVNLQGHYFQTETGKRALESAITLGYSPRLEHGAPPVHPLPSLSSPEAPTDTKRDGVNDDPWLLNWTPPEPVKLVPPRKAKPIDSVTTKSGITILHDGRNGFVAIKRV